MSNFKFNEAFLYAKRNGKRARKIELAQILWEDASRDTARANMANLVSGRTKRIEIKDIPTICDYLGVSADYLFGLTDYPTKSAEYDALKKRVDTFIGKISKAESEFNEIN